MNLSETARALSLVQAFDQRTVGDADVIAWQSILPDAALADVEEAVRRHYAEQTDRIMPAHVRRLVRDIQREREAAARSTGWAPGQAGVPRGQAVPEVTAAVKAEDLPPDVLDLVTRIRAYLPEGSREALMPRRVAWEREHEAFVRTRNAEPNPLYRPSEERECVVTGDGECQTHNRHVSSCPASGRGPVAPRVCRGAVCEIELCVYRAASPDGTCSLA